MIEMRLSYININIKKLFNKKIGKIISTDKSQVGKYIDINGDGIPEGVIFADLAVGGEGRWWPSDCEWLASRYLKHTSYVIPPVKEGLKDYIVTDTYTHPINGKQEVLAPSGEGIDRFYIMDINDSIKNSCSIKSLPFFDKVKTKAKFGTGRQNTINILNQWKNDICNQKDDKDLWNYIQDKVDNGWFIPSCEEWSAFNKNLNIREHTNVSFKGFYTDYYCVSTQTPDKNFYITYWTIGFEPSQGNELLKIRLAKTI